ncbi:hypothetical protein ACVBEH_16625 [Roseateles sp. GG27B]
MESAPAPRKVSADTIHWLVQDVPPHFSFLAGKAPQRPADLGAGEIDGFLRGLIARLPQYQHRFVDAGMPRFETLARQGQTICSTLHLRTPERLSWLYFTHLYPPLFARQIHVIVNRDNLAKFAPQGLSADHSPLLSLSDILQRNDLVGLLPRGRSFGPKVDALLRAYPQRAPQTVAVVRSTHLLNMLSAHRMDYTLEYPSVVDNYLKTARGNSNNNNGSGNTDAKQQLVKLPIAEGRSTAVATAGCSRTPEGLKQITAIDLAVRQLAQDPQREAWLSSWRGNPPDEQDRQLINRYMDERARGGPQIE